MHGFHAGGDEDTEGSQGERHQNHKGNKLHNIDQVQPHSQYRGEGKHDESLEHSLSAPSAGFPQDNGGAGNGSHQNFLEETKLSVPHYGKGREGSGEKHGHSDNARIDEVQKGTSSATNKAECTG
ncbi:MAG: hypothetical protein DDT18_01512 [Actinobacteria bacterium]|nr:hypothetical protein [Actinomycetota bacterium]